MSQIDKVVYLPLLFWFWVFFLIFYGFVFSYIVTYFYLTFRTRNYYVDELVTFSYNCYYFINTFSFFCVDIMTKNFFNVLYIYLKNIWFFSLTTLLKRKYIVG